MLGDYHARLRAQEATLHLVIAVYGTESVLPDVHAMHTIEMIPKSMILIRNRGKKEYMYTFVT